jgi:fimbrial isopeptide formation D2 family protein
VVKDKDGSVKTGEYTSYIVQVVGTVEVKAKASETTSQKKVMDINDSTGVKEGWQDSADYDIGDKVSFQLTAEITSKYGDYDKYYLVFHDKGSVGLTFDKDSVVVKIDNQVITEDYEVVTNASGEV